MTLKEALSAVQNGCLLAITFDDVPELYYPGWCSSHTTIIDALNLGDRNISRFSPAEFLYRGNIVKGLRIYVDGTIIVGA